jgi:mRNA interferase RelE/StbE
LTYEIVFDEKAVDFLRSLPENLRKRVFNKIYFAKEKPFSFFERLVGRKDYKLRVGDYRVIADIDTVRMRIEVTVIGHRKNVYDKS